MIILRFKFPPYVFATMLLFTEQFIARNCKKITWEAEILPRHVRLTKDVLISLGRGYQLSVSGELQFLFNHESYGSKNTEAKEEQIHDLS